MNDELKNQLTRVHSRLAALRRSKWRTYRRWDGVLVDRFKRMTPVAEESLHAFEQTHGIKLPPDYRAFLAIIGEEAPGPYGNMLPLGQWADLASNLEHSVRGSHLAMPCSLEASTEFINELDPDFLADPEPYRGLLPIADRRSDDPWIECSPNARCALVITGATRGRVVYVGDEDRPPYVMPDASFLDWYERWLDELDAGVDTLRFNHIPRRSEADLIDAFFRSTFPADREDILDSLARHDPLTERSDEVLRAGMADTHAAVRAAAVRRLPSRGAHFVPLILAHLQDNAASVRNAAITVLRREKNVADHIPEINAALEQERDAHVFFTIAHALHEVNGLQLASLARQVNNPNAGIRAHIAYFFNETDGFDGAEGLEQLLSDENATASLYALSAFHRRGRRASINWIAARLATVTDPAARARLEQALDILRAQPPTVWYQARNFLHRLGFWWL